MSLRGRLETLERRLPPPPPPPCPTCGLTWFLGVLITVCGAPNCLDCGAAIMFTHDPRDRPPPPLSPRIEARECDRCGKQEVTAYYAGHPEQMCAACWSAADRALGSRPHVSRSWVAPRGETCAPRGAARDAYSASAATAALLGTRCP